jgi:Druantia protein DruA
MIQQIVESSGRSFTPDEISLIRQTTKTFSNLSLTELSRTLCELLEWKRPNGKLKWEECRALLERLNADGIISIPKLRSSGSPGPRKVNTSAHVESEAPVMGSAGQFEPLSLQLVQACNRELTSVFKQLIERWHYLGHKIPFGAHARYLVASEKLPGRYLACLQFSSPAWKMAPRDAWIGWSAEERKRNLQFIVSNSRFLIPPYVSVRGLASKILSLAAQRLSQDWERLYGYRPLLLETLVERAHFRGTCYKAGNWIYLGCTQGRGRMDRDHVLDGQSVKDIYVYPLCRHAQEKLRSAEPPVFVDTERPEAFV